MLRLGRSMAAHWRTLLAVLSLDNDGWRYRAEAKLSVASGAFGDRENINNCWKRPHPHCRVGL